MKKIVLFVVNIENLKNFITLKYHTFSEKTLIFSIICSKCENEDEKMFKEKELTEILKVLGLIKVYKCFKICLKKILYKYFKICLKKI